MEAKNTLPWSLLTYSGVQVRLKLAHFPSSHQSQKVSMYHSCICILETESSVAPLH